jgi:hypothetical protein
LPNFNGKLYKQNLFKTIMEALRMKWNEFRTSRNINNGYISRTLRGF